MNKRIQKLFNEAGFHQPEMERLGIEDKFEKFAVLIVKECANVITDDDLAKDCGTFMMDSYAKGMRYSAHLIKEHFGVEE
jgi:hypothetical protein